MSVLASKCSRNWNKPEPVTLHESNKWVVFIRRQTSNGNETGRCISGRRGKCILPVKNEYHWTLRPKWLMGYPGFTRPLQANGENSGNRCVTWRAVQDGWRRTAILHFCGSKCP